MSRSNGEEEKMPTSEITIVVRNAIKHFRAEGREKGGKNKTKKKQNDDETVLV